MSRFHPGNISEKRMNSYRSWEITSRKGKFDVCYREKMCFRRKFGEKNFCGSCGGGGGKEEATVPDNEASGAGYVVGSLLSGIF